LSQATPTIDATTTAAGGALPGRRRRPLVQERGMRIGADGVLRYTTAASATLILLMLAALIVILARAAMPAVHAFGWGFLAEREWRANELSRPLIGPDGKTVKEDGETVMETIPPKFGAMPVIYGTVVTSGIALAVAVPLSLGAALFLTRISGRRFATPVSFLIEFLAAIPSIAYGIWGLFVMAPFLQEHLEPFCRSMLGNVPGFFWMFHQKVQVGKDTIVMPIAMTGRDMLAGGLILAIMIIPIITALSRDILRSVPRAQIEGTLALGATWWQSCKEMVRFSRSALFGAVMLGLARAAGETMAVTMVIGNVIQINPSPFAPAQTMSSLLATQFGEANNELHRAALVEVALILLVMSLAFNVVARWLVVGGASRTAQAH